MSANDKAGWELADDLGWEWDVDCWVDARTGAVRVQQSLGVWTAFETPGHFASALEAMRAYSVAHTPSPRFPTETRNETRLSLDITIASDGTLVVREADASEMVTAWLPPELAAKIARAAEVAGQSVGDFVRDAAVERMLGVANGEGR